MKKENTVQETTKPMAYNALLAVVIGDYEKIIEKTELDIPMIMVEVRKAMREGKKRREYQYLIVNRKKAETKIMSYKEAIRILRWRANNS